MENNFNSGYIHDQRQPRDSTPCPGTTVPFFPESPVTLGITFGKGTDESRDFYPVFIGHNATRDETAKSLELLASIIRAGTPCATKDDSHVSVEENFCDFYGGDKEYKEGVYPEGFVIKGFSRA